MCGISAIIDSSNFPIVVNTIRSMNDTIIHRGPDAEGFYYGDNFALGSRRLAILDLRKEGNQPMYFKDQYVLVYNGEIYNYLEIKNILQQEGYKFETTTDTEVVLAAYDFWGEDCVSHFNGMWAFVLHDKKTNKLFCSRDRFGIKPLYYFQQGTFFYLASEIKQFTKVQNWKPLLNKTRAYEFLAHGYLDHTSETCFKNVFALSPGKNLIYNLQSHQFSISTYYDLKDNIQQKKSSEHLLSDFKNLFTNSLQIYLRSDVPVGASLSGGLDSSTIVCLLDQFQKEKNNTNTNQLFAVCSKNKKYSEENFIDEVLAKTKLSCYKLFPNFDDFLKNMDKLVWHHDEPFWDISKFAGFQLYQTAKEKNIKVMLNGQGADEILAGYDKFYQPYFLQMLKQEKLKLPKALYHYFKKHNSSLGKMLKLALLSKRKQNGNSLSWLNQQSIDLSTLFKRSADDTLTNCSINMLNEVGITALLKFEDRNAMAASVETRIPFLDHRLVEFSLSLPDEWKINNGVRKYILREAFKPILPPKIYHRYDKQGFLTPDELWLRQNPAWAKEAVAEAQFLSQGLIDPKINTLLDDFFAGKFHDFAIFWRVIFFGRWVKVFGIESIN